MNKKQVYIELIDFVISEIESTTVNDLGENPDHRAIKYYSKQIESYSAVGGELIDKLKEISND